MVAPLVAASIIGGGSSVIGGLFGKSGASKQADAAREAAMIQAQSAREQLAFQREMWEQQRSDIAPWLTAGEGALGRMQTMGETSMTDQMGELDIYQDPSYQFRVQEGQKALENLLSGSGMSQSGSAMKAALRYGQQMGTQEYGAAYGRRQGELNEDWRRQQTLGNYGAGALGAQVGSTQNLASAGTQSMQYGANALAQGAMGAGNAAASGYNAMGQGISGAMQTGANAMMLDWMNNQGMLPQYQRKDANYYMHGGQ